MMKGAISLNDVGRSGGVRHASMGGARRGEEAESVRTSLSPAPRASGESSALVLAVKGVLAEDKEGSSLDRGGSERMVRKAVTVALPHQTCVDVESGSHFSESFV